MSSVLTPTVASIQQDLRRVKLLLRENAALKAELATRPPPAPELDLESLRRKVVFYCHPDRGGDSDLLRDVLALFTWAAATATAGD